MLRLCLLFFVSIVLLISASHPESDPLSSEERALLDKYSESIGTPVENVKLYKIIDKWIGVRYQYAGNSYKGIDCSHLVCAILKEAFEYNDDFYMPSSSLSNQGEEVDWGDLKEGDLVCFSISRGSRISHVGIYLDNNKFIHASSSKGVIISSLDEPYYIQRLLKVRRISRDN